jgi:hypothetical protein
MNESLSAGDMTPELSVAIPCYNEEAVVAYTVRPFRRSEIGRQLFGAQRGDWIYMSRPAGG